LSFQEGKEFVQKNLVPIGIDTLRKWKDRIEEIPIFLPFSPPTYWKNKGWTSSSDFFGTQKKKVGEFQAVRSYEAAAEWVQNNLVPAGINTSTKWKAWIGRTYIFPEGAIIPILPDDVPKYPHIRYRNCGWKFWNHFLGTRRVSVKERGAPWTYEGSHHWVSDNLKGALRNGSDWKRYVAGEIEGLPMLPIGISRKPHISFAKTGEWNGWQRFLGVEEIAVTKKNPRKRGRKTVVFLSYAEAKQFIKEELVPLGINSYGKYRIYNELPVFLPVNAHIYYSQHNRGWVSKEDYLGLRIVTVE
jgi:hypothetical protein